VSTGFVRKSAPLLHGADRLLDGAEGGHHHDGRLGVGVERRLQHVETAAHGQLQVRQHDQVAKAASLRRACSASPASSTA
jgi:hypothetical protein